LALAEGPTLEDQPYWQLPMVVVLYELLGEFLNLLLDVDMELLESVGSDRHHEFQREAPMTSRAAQVAALDEF